MRNRRSRPTNEGSKTAPAPAPPKPKMNRWAFFWGLILGTLAVRLVFGHLIDLPAVPDIAPFTVSALVATACLGVALFVGARALVQKVPRRGAEPAARPALGEARVLARESRLDEAHRQLAARSEQLVFVRELLQTRTVEMERLADERTSVQSRLAEAQADADRWRGEQERVAAELQAERTRFAGELSRLSGELLRETLEASRRASDLIEALRELARRTQDTEALRTEVAGLRAELAQAHSASALPPVPQELIEQHRPRSRRAKPRL